MFVNICLLWNDGKQHNSMAAQHVANHQAINNQLLVRRYFPWLLAWWPARGVKEGGQGGQHSKNFLKFQNLMIKGFMALREHAEEIISFVEMSIVSGIDLPCF